MGKKEETKKARLIFTGRKIGAFAERLRSIPDLRKADCVMCSDIFDTIVKIATTGDNSGGVVCMDLQEAGGFAQSFFDRFGEYGITCCCLDEARLAGNLSLPENVMIARNERHLETMLVNLFPAYFGSSTDKSEDYPEGFVKPGFTLTRGEINALFGESDS